MSDTRTLKEMLAESGAVHSSFWHQNQAEAIVRRAAEVARSTPPQDTENEDVTWAGDCADAILADAGLKDE